MTKVNMKNYQEVLLTPKSGMGMLAFIIGLILGFITGFGFGISFLVQYEYVTGATIVILSILGFIFALFLAKGFKIVKPNEAIVLALFGKYLGSIKTEGFFWVNPFAIALNPASGTTTKSQLGTTNNFSSAGSFLASTDALLGRKISLKVMTLSNNNQKINDLLGNPIEVGINVVWRVSDTAKAVFQVDNFKEFLAIQCDSALRNIVRSYPYDAIGEDNEKSLRGSSVEIAEKLKTEIQSMVDVGGLEILEANITHLAYAPEIATAMLQRQQASAVVDTKQIIVENAVDMVEMAVNKLASQEIIELDDERKAAMVSNLLVVLCSDSSPQPIVNSGSIY